MPTRKQRRRDAKLRRHEYEEVYVDADGREIPAEEFESEQPKRATKDGRPVKAAKKNGKPVRDARGRTIREVQPPSWRRSLRRVAIFGPILFFVLLVTNKHGSSASSIAIAVIYAALLAPFTFLLDRLTYRTYLRRTGQAPPAVPFWRNRK